MAETAGGPGAGPGIGRAGQGAGRGASQVAGPGMGAIERPALGVGTIFTDTFAIFFRRPHWFLLLAVGPAALIHVLDNLLSAIMVTDGTDYDLIFSSALIYWGLSMLAATVGGSLGIALIVQAAEDTRFGRRTRPLAYVGRMLRCAVPVAFLAVGLGIFKAIGIALLVVPGVWLLGLWVAVIPAVVLERAGVGAVARSHALTLGYRWPAAGAFIIIWLLMAIIEGALSALLFGFGMFSADYVLDNQVVYFWVSQALVTAVQLSLTGICTALIFARLREIREGLPPESLAEVFE